jgi:hypothetical protein
MKRRVRPSGGCQPTIAVVAQSGRGRGGRFRALAAIALLITLANGCGGSGESADRSAASNLALAQQNVGFTLHAPRGLPAGYDLVAVGWTGNSPGYSAGLTYRLPSGSQALVSEYGRNAPAGVTPDVNIPPPTGHLVVGGVVWNFHGPHLIIHRFTDGVTVEIVFGPPMHAAERSAVAGAIR